MAQVKQKDKDINYKYPEAVIYIRNIILRISSNSTELIVI